MTEKFTRSIALFGKNNFEKIRKAKICVVGIGGVGSFAAEALVRTGVGSLVIIDDDAIEVSNINRQVWALHSTIGKSKIDVAKSRLLDINPELEIVARAERLTSANVEELISKEIDFVIDAIDTISDKIALIAHCLREGISIISCMGAARRTNPTEIEIGELSNDKISGPLIKRLRKGLREQNIPIKFPIIYSEEKAVKVEKSKPLPSCCFTTGAVGLAAASYVCATLIETKQ